MIWRIALLLCSCVVSYSNNCDTVGCVILYSMFMHCCMLESWSNCDTAGCAAASPFA